MVERRRGWLARKVAGRSRSANEARVVLVGPLSLGRDDNPYQRLIYGSFAPALTLRPLRWWINLAGDLIHLHWYESLFHRRLYTRAPRAMRRLILWGMALQLRLFKVCGGQIVWTAHNAAPHELDEDINRHWHRDVAPLIDAIVAMSQDTRNALIASGVYRNARFHIIAHPHYGTVFRLPADSATDRRALGIAPDAVVYGSIGRVRGYKRIAQFITLFKAIRRENEFLLIAGKGASEIAEAGAECIIVDKYLDDDEIAAMHGVCRAIFINYESITNSGAALAAISLGRVIVAPRVPALTRIAADFLPDRFSFFVSGDAADLRRSLDQAVMKTDPDKAAGRDKSDLAGLAPDVISARYKALFFSLCGAG